MEIQRKKKVLGRRRKRNLLANYVLFLLKKALLSKGSKESLNSFGLQETRLLLQYRTDGNTHWTPNIYFFLFLLKCNFIFYVQK
jgi:hypothetical protein